MKMTWSEMREEIYSLVFADEKDRKLYEPAMINGVNYAVRDLLLRVCPDIRSVEVCVAEPENLIGAGGGSALYVLRRGKTAVFSVENCECVSFCYKGEGELHIESGGTLTVYPQEYSENFKEFTLTTDKTERIRITLLSDTQMIVKDLGLYEYGTGFSPWKKYVGFDMYELTQGHFAGLYEKRAVVSVKDDGLYDGYYFEMPCRIYFARENTGMFRIYYYHCPKPFDKNTPLSEYVDIPYECAKLVCLYAAWRILRDDNERLAAMYYNEYVDASEEMGRRNLTERYLSAEIWQQGVML